MRDSDLSDVVASSSEEDDESATSDVDVDDDDATDDASESDGSPPPPAPPPPPPPPPPAPQLMSCAPAEPEALQEKMRVLDDAIVRGDVENARTLRNEIDALFARALSEKEAQRACAVDLARTFAKELHARCVSALPCIADALRDVRALEERLVNHQRAATEALEAVAGAVAAGARSA